MGCEAEVFAFGDSAGYVVCSRFGARCRFVMIGFGLFRTEIKFVFGSDWLDLKAAFSAFLHLISDKIGWLIYPNKKMLPSFTCKHRFPHFLQL